MNQLVFSFNSVALPSMSALRNEPAKYRRYYEKAISILSFISMPLAIYACVFSEGLIQLILGDKWIQSADILRILAVGAFIQPITSACGIVMVSYGKTKEYFLWGLMSALCVVIAFSVGIAWGPIGIAAAYSIFNYVILMPSLFYSFRNTPMSVSSLFKAISHPLIASLITGFVLMSIHQQTSLLGNIAEIVITLPLAVVIYGSVWALLPGGRARLGEFFSYLQTIIKSAPITVKQDA